MEARLSLKTQGVRGREPKWVENMGYVLVFLDNVATISVDAFKNSGDQYKRRDECNVYIKDNQSVLFNGTFKELSKILNNAKKND